MRIFLPAAIAYAVFAPKDVRHIAACEVSPTAYHKESAGSLEWPRHWMRDQHIPQWRQAEGPLRGAQQESPSWTSCQTFQGSDISALSIIELLSIDLIVMAKYLSPWTTSWEHSDMCGGRRFHLCPGQINAFPARRARRQRQRRLSFSNAAPTALPAH